MLTKNQNNKVQDTIQKYRNQVQQHMCSTISRWKNKYKFIKHRYNKTYETNSQDMVVVNLYMG